MRIRSEQRGTATLEMMFAFPIIFLVLICGLMLAYAQFAKTALVWHVFQRTEDLAVHTRFSGVADSIYGTVFKEPPAGLGGKTTSLAFAVPIPGHEFSFTVACTATPLQIPRFDFGKAASPTSAPPPARNAFEWLDRLVRSVHAYVNQAGGLLDEGEDILDDAFFANELIGQLASERAATQDQGYRLAASWALQEGMAKTVCVQQGKQVIAARAVAWNEKTKAYKKAGVGQVGGSH